MSVFAVGGLGVSISALENLVELQPALVKRVEGQFYQVLKQSKDINLRDIIW